MIRPIDRVRQTHRSGDDTVLRFEYRFHPHDWAIFYVDLRFAGVTIQSDWGCWAHTWGGSPKTWGHSTFTDFLRSMSSGHYMADKLSYGRTRQVPDPEATEKSMKDHVHGLIITPDEADELREQIDNFCEGLQDSVDVAFLCIQHDCDELKEEFDCLHEWVEMKTAPKIVFLTEELLPVFLADLRGTLQIITAEEYDRRRSHGNEAQEGP